jgi:tetratricopeptide (TPR) repeat protein/TolB-like protein/predicted Ser/Thr protein kinase
MKCPKCGADNAPGSLRCITCAADLSPGETEVMPGPPANLAPGAIFAGRYRIAQELGKGGMGVVYKAEDVKLRRPVAIKFLPWWLTCDDTARERFIHEAQAASALDHTNICTIYEVDETADKQTFMAMAFCEGQPLKKIIAAGPLDVDAALDIAIQTCDGLAAAHEAGMIHRDIKPANIMVNAHGHVKIVDFGLAKLAGQTRLTRAGTVVGTVAYMAPEQARGDDVDGRADLWALGVVLYEMLTGRHPFRGDSDQAVIHAILNEDPDSLARHNKKVPTALERAVLRCLRKTPDERYANADDLQAELVAIRGAHPTTSASGRILKRPPALSPRGAARRRRTMALCAGVAVCAVAALSMLPPGRPLVSVKKAGQWIGFRGLPAGRYVALLPFAVAAGDPETKALADGLVEAQTRKLSVIDGFTDSLWVAAVGDVFSSKVRTATEARDLLGANLAITGSLSVSGDLVDLTLNLVDTATGVRLATKKRSDPIANLATWQDSVPVIIAGMVGVRLAPDQRSRLRIGSTDVPSAFRNYLLGRGYLRPCGGAQNLDAAEASLASAIEADSSFAMAHSALGEVCRERLKATKDTTWAAKGAACCERAISLNDSLTVPHVILSLIDTDLGRPDQAIRHLQDAIAADSNYAEAYYVIAGVYKQTGQDDLAIGALKQSIRLRPKSYNSYNSLGEIYLSEGEYEKAIKPFQAMISVVPRRTSGYNNLGAAYCALDRLPEAEEMFRRSLEIAPQYMAYSNLGTINYYKARYADAAAMYRKAIDIKDDDYKVWGHYAESCYWTPAQREKGVAIYQTAASLAETNLGRSADSVVVLADLASYYTVIGDRAKSAAYLQRVLVTDPKDINAIVRVAETYEGLGDRDKALQWIGKAFEAGCPPLRIDRAPGLSALRSDRRFETLKGRHQS